MKYAVAFDPGEVNLGVAVIDLESYYMNKWKGVMKLIDFTVQSGKRYELTDSDRGVVVYDLIRSMDNIIQHTVAVGIEAQPPFGTRPIYAIQCHLESCIRGANMNAHIYLTSGKAVRNFWGTKGTTYVLRKIASMTSTMLNDQDAARVRQTFTRQDKGNTFKVDPVEAMQICGYLVANIEQLPAPILSKTTPRSFKELTIDDCQISIPEKKDGKKRTRQSEKDNSVRKKLKRSEETENHLDKKISRMFKKLTKKNNSRHTHN